MPMRPGSWRSSSGPATPSSRCDEARRRLSPSRPSQKRSPGKGPRAPCTPGGTRRATPMLWLPMASCPRSSSGPTVARRVSRTPISTSRTSSGRAAAWRAGRELRRVVPLRPCLPEPAVGHVGVVDVRDCIDAVRVVVERGLADPERVAIMGGSAGGYTTLQALVTSDVFAAGLSDYGISDLATLATDTHKFEGHYTDRLVAPWPDGKDLYEERSPIHHLDRLNSPMLLQQGADDRVVPPSQAREMAAAVRAKGLPVALVVYEGEGHGFRRADTIVASLNAKLSFLAQVFEFNPAGDVAVLAIDNLEMRHPEAG